MSTDAIQSYQGKWRFDGETPYDFDEVDLRIDDEKLIYILKRKGIEVKTVDIPNNSESLDDGYVAFYKDNVPVFFVSDINGKTMLCGEISGEMGERKNWEVIVRRVY